MTNYGDHRQRLNLAIARFMRAFEALYCAGVVVSKAFEMAVSACGNSGLERRLRRALPMLAEGADVAQAIECTYAFSPVITGMIATGVESGHLDEMLDKAAVNAEESARNSIKLLGVILPLLIYFIIAGVIAWGIISVFGGYVNQMKDLL